jgi:putative transposase
VLLRLAYLGVTSAFALLRLLPMSDRDKDVEILALRHQLTVLQRQLGTEKVRFDPSDRAFLAALLHRLPRDVLRRVRLLVRPDTVLRWHTPIVWPRRTTQLNPSWPYTVEGGLLGTVALSWASSCWQRGYGSDEAASVCLCRGHSRR